MSQSLACIPQVVGDYDEAIAWYRNTLGCDLIEPRPTHTETRFCASHFRTRRPHPDTPCTHTARQSQGNRDIPLRVSGL